MQLSICSSFIICSNDNWALLVFLPFMWGLISMQVSSCQCCLRMQRLTGGQANGKKKNNSDFKVQATRGLKGVEIRGKRRNKMQKIFLFFYNHLS